MVMVIGGIVVGLFFVLACLLYWLNRSNKQLEKKIQEVSNTNTEASQLHESEAETSQVLKHMAFDQSVDSQAIGRKYHGDITTTEKQEEKISGSNTQGKQGAALDHSISCVLREEVLSDDLKDALRDDERRRVQEEQEQATQLQNESSEFKMLAKSQNDAHTNALSTLSTGHVEKQKTQIKIDDKKRELLKNPQLPSFAKKIRGADSAGPAISPKGGNSG